MNDKRILYEVAKKYNLKSTPPSSINQSKLEEITARVIEKCRSQLEAADAAERASYQLANAIWIP